MRRWLYALVLMGMMLVHDLGAPGQPDQDWELPPPPPANRRPPAVLWLFQDTGRWAYTTVSLRIIELAEQAWHDELGRVPTLTGTTDSVEYRYERDHLDGCAADFRVWGMTFEQAWDVSQRLAAYLQWELHVQSRVVLWWNSRVHPDHHIHAAVQNCGQPLTGDEVEDGRTIRPLWAWNGRP